ncbi:MAG: hypothetical protein R3A52_24475 [Polyangiales bacterium]
MSIDLTRPGSAPTSALALWDVTTSRWSAASSVPLAGSGRVASLGDALYVAHASGVFRVDEGALTQVSPAFDTHASISAFTAWGDSLLVAGGLLARSPFVSVARVDPTTGVRTPMMHASQQVLALAPRGDTVVVGGSFLGVDELPRVFAGGVVAYDTRRGAWSTFAQGLSRDGGGILEPPAVRALAWVGDTLYAAGSFPAGLARWNVAATRWEEIEGIRGSVYVLAACGGDLYVGGDFDAPSHGIVRWDGARFWPMGTGVSGERPDQPAAVYAMTAAPDGALYVTGNFTEVHGRPSRYIARWR